jgi:hypothetical protein
MRPKILQVYQSGTTVVQHIDRSDKSWLHTRDDVPDDAYKADDSPDYDRLRGFYKGLHSTKSLAGTDLPTPDWEEVLMGFREDGFDVREDGIYTRAVRVASTAVRAMQKGFEDGIRYHGTLVPTFDRCGKLGVVLRGGSLTAGQVLFFTGGQKYDLSHIENAEEEGLHEGGFPLGVVVRGVFENEEGWPKIVLRGYSQATGKEFEEKHSAAKAVYDKAKVQGYTEQEARQAIGQGGHVNVDAWEHRMVAFVDPTWSAVDSFARRHNSPFHRLLRPALEILAKTGDFSMS